MEGVLQGRIPANELVRLAIERHQRDLAEGGSQGLWFDEEAAWRVIHFKEAYCKHVKNEWAGQLIRLSPWQVFINWAVFGWKRADGLRRFRVVYIEVARKNGKTTEMAATGNYLTVADLEPGAEVYSAATKKDQAKLVWTIARRMIRVSDDLKEVCRTLRDNISVEETNSKFEPLGSDEDTLDGLNVHAAIIDELHAHKHGGVWHVLDTATGARRQPLIIAITTAGVSRESICWDQHEYSERLLRGLIEDDTHFAFIAGIDKDDNWEDERVWAKANPNLGISVKLDDLRRKAAKAKKAPKFLNEFLRKHLNVWVRQETRFFPMDAWDGCFREGSTPPWWEFERLLKGLPCWAGLDLSSTVDLTAFILAFPADEEEEAYYLLPRIWMPEENIEDRVKHDRVPYDVWLKEGLITATPGNTIDHRFIRDQIFRDAETFQIQELAYDRFKATHLIQECQDEGLVMVPFGQGPVSMNAPMQEALRLVMLGRLYHGGHKVMRWSADNLAPKQDSAGNYKPDKAKSREKIDPIVAMLMALGRAMLRAGGGSVYETRGVLTL